MSGFLRQILSADEPVFSHGLRQLEKSAGNHGVDARLIADITHKAHQIMRSLGLDTSDTHGRELYQALINAVKKGYAEKLLIGSEYVLLPIDNQVISFNIYDLVDSAHHELRYGDQIVNYGQKSLRAELVGRYRIHDLTDEETVHGLAISIGMNPAEDSWYLSLKPGMVQDKKPSSGLPKVLAVGDIFTDAFIKLNEDYAKVEADADGKEWLKLPFGEKPPYDYADIVESVGPSPNAAVAFARLGLEPHLMSWLGDDEVGQRSVKRLNLEGVNTDQMVVQTGSKSSYWYVLRFGSDRTMLVKNEDYKYEWHDPKIKPDWIYLAYTGKDSWALHEGLLGYLEKNKDIKLVFQPGTFHFEWGKEKLRSVYSRAYLVVMNREEAAVVIGKEPKEKVLNLAKDLHELGPDVVIVTDGPDGSYAYDGKKLISVPNYPDPAPPYDRTGAGDAFASSVVAALALGKGLEEALQWAAVNSMSVVQKLGAQAGLLDQPAIREYIKKAPKDFQAREVEK